MTVHLYLVHETKNARLWRRETQKPRFPDIWIPRSVCKSFVKHPPANENELPLCEVEVEDWFARKYNL